MIPSLLKNQFALFGFFSAERALVFTAHLAQLNGALFQFPDLFEITLALQQYIECKRCVIGFNLGQVSDTHHAQSAIGKTSGEVIGSCIAWRAHHDLFFLLQNLHD
jgi:hypothetical protein